MQMWVCDKNGVIDTGGGRYLPALVVDKANTPIDIDKGGGCRQRKGLGFDAKPEHVTKKWHQQEDAYKVRVIDRGDIHKKELLITRGEVLLVGAYQAGIEIKKVEAWRVSDVTINNMLEKKREERTEGLRP